MNTIHNTFQWIYSKKGLPYLVLCLTLIGMLNMGVTYVYLIFLFCLTVLTGCRFRLYFDNTAYMILFFSLSYVTIPFIMGRSPNVAFSLYFGTAPVFFYVYGRLLIDELYKMHSKDRFVDLILGIVICSTIYIFYSFFVRQGIEFGMVTEQRSISLTGGKEKLLATAIGNHLCMSFIGLSCFFYLKTNFVRRVIFLVVFGLSITVTTFLLNRAGLLLSVITFLVISLYYSKKNFLRTFLYFAILFLVAYLMLGGDTYQDLFLGYESRNEDSGVAGGRFERWGIGVKNLIEHPWGWHRAENLLAHNMWLDIGGNSGVIPFILISLITFRSIKQVIYIFKIKGSDITVLLLSIYSCFFFSMLGEPFLESVPIYVLVFFMICGCLRQYSANLGMKTRNN